ncbi:putative ribonuclease H-like domain-containing protein [Tanacetum coccineum]
MLSLENTGIFDDAYDDREEVGAKADLNNLETTMNVSSIPTTRIHKDHLIEQIIGDLHSAPLTRRTSQQNLAELGLVSYINKQRRTNHKDYQNWIEAMQEGLLQFKLQKVWTLVDLPKEKRAIGTKWVYKNKKDNRGIVVRNKARLVVQGYTQEKGIDYDEVFAPVARIKAIRLILAHASFVGLITYQMDVKSAFLYGTIEEEVYVCQPPSFEDLQFQVTPKVSHLHAVKRIFRYLKGQPKLGLWYPRDSPFDLEAFSDSDYAGASLDRKSTTGGCQFLGKRLISWQCKKQTIVANSTTEAEYVAAANCCGQVLWIQNQMLDYGFNFMNTKIHIDNESTICIVKNPVFHSKTKHIEIRHHFIRDSYEKRLIQVIKIHTDHNVADLLTKAFDVSSDEFGVKTGSCKVNAARQDLVLLGKS